MSNVTKTLVTHYDACLAQHGPSPRGMDWENEERLRLRFDALARSIGPDLAGSSLLDVGCGSGLLLDFLRQSSAGQSVRYTGVDASANMIEAARSTHPDVVFQVDDAAQLAIRGDFDYVVANGLFTLKSTTDLADMDRFFETVVQNMYRTCRKGIAFNVMTKYVDFEVPHLYYRDPRDVLDFCIRNLSRRVVILHDYPLYEFFVCVRKTASN